MVLEAVGMVIHIATIEKESGISRFRYIAIPYLLIGGGVSFYGVHSTCLKNSS